MLHLVNYDLGGKGVVFKALKDAVATLAGSRDKCHKAPGGPWLLRTKHSVEQVLNAVDKQSHIGSKGDQAAINPQAPGLVAR